MKESRARLGTRQQKDWEIFKLDSEQGQEQEEDGFTVEGLVETTREDREYSTHHSLS